MGTVILGTGSCLPDKIVTNDDIAKIVDTSDEWIRTRTGIRTRRVCGQDEQTYNLATRAARRAIAAAGIGVEEIGLIVVATISSHTLMPSSACLVQKELGATKAFAYDINAACSGFLFGIDLAHKYVQADHGMKVLVVGAENLSSRLNWSDRNTCILFGDGAGAAVVGYRDGASGYLGANLRSDGSLWELLYMYAPKSSNPDITHEDHPGTYIIMEGKEVFKHAVKAMEDAIHGVLAREGIGLDAVKLLVPHQANIRILNKLAERLQMPADDVVINVSEYGNTSAASIPIALDEAVRAGRIQEGDVILLCSFGGGFTWGATLIKW
ncbi:MAG: ketoacyl-ACP synthase III [Desulfobulbaceae bacterium]|nr:MAG: ketoacyl-ACP synthase III [Desulfobulbaceae bacterium]